MKALHEVTTDEIQQADWINAVDPDSGQWETLWGSEVWETATCRETSILDVDVRRGDYINLLSLIDRIEGVRGRLPARIQVLRENLQLATLLRTKVYSDEDAVVAD